MWLYYGDGSDAVDDAAAADGDVYEDENTADDY